MYKLNEIKTYFIVLKSRPERVVNVQAQIAMNDIKNHEIIEAINGNEMSAEDKNYWLNPKNFYGMHITKTKKETVLGRVGCTLSHFKALERSIEANEFPCMIVEDDVLLRTKDVEFENMDTAMIYLGGTFSRPHNAPITKEFMKSNSLSHRIYWRLDKNVKLFCTIAYIIPSGKAARVILDRLKEKKQKRTIDVMYIREIQSKGYGCYVFKEPLAEQLSMISMASSYGEVQKLNKYGCVTKIEL